MRNSREDTLFAVCRILFAPLYVLLCFGNMLAIPDYFTNPEFVAELARGQYRSWIWYYQSEAHYFGSAIFMVLWSGFGFALCLAKKTFRKPKLLLAHGLLTAGHIVWIQLWLRDL